MQSELSVDPRIMSARDSLSADKAERPSTDAHAEIRVAYYTVIVTEPIRRRDVCVY